MITAELANHLWQSTFFALLCGVAALTLRKNPASVRHGIWLAASIKFLVPFSLLVMAAGHWGTRAIPPAVPERVPSGVMQASQPFSDTVLLPHFTLPGSQSRPVLPGLAAAAWLAGFLALLCFWCVRWMRVRHLVRSATPLRVHAGIAVRSSQTVAEPGVFGIFRPVLLLPQGIEERLTPGQLSAVLAHELCHVRRRDNLWAAIHMLVEAIFWFHPLVWFIGARLVEERERACDDEVLRSGNEPEAYAEGILNVCRLYLRCPLPCVSGVTGSDLKKRIEAIMNHRLSSDLSRARKLLLAAAAAIAIAAPVLFGLLRAQQADLAFEVASIKPTDPATRGFSIRLMTGGGVHITGGTLKELITFSYDVLDSQVSGGPPWMDSARFDILAKPERPETTDLNQTTYEKATAVHDRQRARLRALLSERFRLAIHRENRELPVYTIVVARGGRKFEDAKPEANGRFGIGAGRISADACTLDILVRGLTFALRRPVVDLTGLTGKYNYKLEWRPEPLNAAADAPTDPAAPSLFTVIQEQLGLKLEAARRPVETIVIDGAEKPTEN